MLRISRASSWSWDAACEFRPTTFCGRTAGPSRCVSYHLLGFGNAGSGPPGFAQKNGPVLRERLGRPEFLARGLHDRGRIHLQLAPYGFEDAVFCSHCGTGVLFEIVRFFIGFCQGENVSGKKCLTKRMVREQDIDVLATVRTAVIGMAGGAVSQVPARRPDPRCLSLNNPRPRV